MKDSHNSCNVSAEAPEEGHIWQLLTDKDGNTFIINTLKMKILAFDTGYSSWGAYPEITETRLSKIQLIKATAPETDPEPETPDVPDVPDVPSNVPEFVTNPEVGTGYKFALYQANLKKYLYFTGAMDGNFFAMSENAAEAVDVYMEATEGGYYFYFLNGETKTYLSLEGYEKDGKQRASVKLTAEATTVFAYSEDAKTYVSVVGSDTFYLGTYNNFATISASSISYITGDKASNVGVTQFVAAFCTMTGAPETPEQPEQPETPEQPEQPEEPEQPETPEVTGTATLATEVAVGDKIVLVNAAGDSAMGAQDETKRVVTAITVTDGVANLTADVVIITLEAGSQEGTFALKVDGGYLAYSGSGNTIATQETVDDAASWTITIVDGVVSIQNVAHTDRFLQYNISAPRFVCYKGTQEAPVIYKVEE